MPQNEVYAQKNEEMGWASLKLAERRVVSSYRYHCKWTRENNVERRRIVIIELRWETIGTWEWGKRAKMIAVSLFIWTLTRPRDRSEIGLESRRNSRRDSLYSRDDRDRADSRRNSKETATIALAIVERRRHRPRRHSRRYYVDRNKRWVACRESKWIWQEFSKCHKNSTAGSD